MDISIYREMLQEFLKSANTFDGVSAEDKCELQEDFETIFETLDIRKHSGVYTGGVVKTTSDLLTALKTANSESDKQRCIESIAMIRAEIMDIESALSNAADSLEKLVISIRDA